MGTVRNRVVIVHGNADRLKELRMSAVSAFQRLVDKYCWSGFDVSENMVSPIYAGLCNSESTFFINGECSKLGWSESDEFEQVREQWCEENKDKCYNIIIVDLGDEYPAELKEYIYQEDE